ncbi:MAG: hypothetical protein Q9160_001977 [Pyrenula sp. 1 TL-2023]
MPPRLRLINRQSLNITSRCYAPPSWLSTKPSARSITADEKPLPTSEQPKGPNQDQLPHVSEEAADMSKITGEGGPDLDQGTPVQEILKRDKDSQEKAPEVLKEDIKADKTTPSSYTESKPSGTRSFSTSTRRRAQELQATSSQGRDQDVNLISSSTPQPNKTIRRLRGIQRQLNKLHRESDNIGVLLGFERPQPTLQKQTFKNIDAAYLDSLKSMTPHGVLPVEVSDLTDPSTKGLKFEMPSLATDMHYNASGDLVRGVSRRNRFKERYEPVINQMTKLLMKDGKLSLAQRHMTTVLTILRTSPPPNPTSSTPLRLPPHTPASSLPLSPTLYLSTVIDSLAPLIKIRQQRGIAGGGASLPIPVPLSERKRRRVAIKWVLDAAEKRREVSAGERVAKVLMDTADGRGGCWDRRNMVHRLGIAGRSNVRLLAGSRARK